MTQQQNFSNRFISEADRERLDCFFTKTQEIFSELSSTERLKETKKRTTLLYSFLDKSSEHGGNEKRKPLPLTPEKIESVNENFKTILDLLEIEKRTFERETKDKKAVMFLQRAIDTIEQAHDCFALALSATAQKKPDRNWNYEFSVSAVSLLGNGLESPISPRHCEVQKKNKGRSLQH